MATLKFDAILENAKVISGFREIQNAVHQTSEKVQSEGKSIDDILDGISSKLNVAIGGWTASQFVNQIMQVRGKFQQTEMAFKTMLQSEEKANTLMKEMIRTAAITPFGVDDVTEGAKQLLAFNVAAEDVNKTLIGLGDVSAGMGIRLSDMVMLYGTTIAKGKMDTMDLYQFLNRGIPIADELAKVMGLDLNNAIAEVQKQIKAGKVTSDVFIQAMQNMTSQGSKFGGLMEAQSQTITGQISNIEDGVEQMFNELGRSQEGVINAGLGIVSKLVDNWETVGKVLLTVVAAYGAYKAAIITLYAIEKARIALNTAVRFIQLAKNITTAAQAMRVFNLACSANVLGLIVGAIAAAVTYFSIFGHKVESVAEQTEKFGEDAKKATSNVESLISILKVADKNSKVYKDTVKELSGIYSNYGIELTKIAEDESNIVAVKDEEIKKSQELIDQIRLESVERNRANAISKANETYNTSVSDAEETLKNTLKRYGEAKSTAITMGVENIVSPELIDRMNNYIEIRSQYVKGTKEWTNANNEYLKINNLINSSVRDLADKFGVSYANINRALSQYISILSDARLVYSSTIKQTNQVADATEELSTKTLTSAERQKLIQKQLQGTGDDVKTLTTRIMNLMHSYGDNDIRFHIKFDAEIPLWMLNKSIPELSRLAKTFTALAKDLADRGKTGANVNGKWESIDEIANKGYNYGRALSKKQDDADAEAKRKAKEKAEAEANAKKNKDAAKKAKDAANKRRQVQEDLNNELHELVRKNIDDELALQKESTEKKLAQIRNEYAKRKEEINKQEKLFKENNKKAGAATNASGLTTDQNAALSKARQLAAEKYNKEIDDARRDELQSMRDYLKKYGSLLQQRQAIEDDYNDKINNAKNDGERFALIEEKKAQLGSFEYDNISKGIDWKSLLNGVSNLSLEMLKPMLAQLQAYTKTSDFTNAPIETQEKTVELIKELKSYIGSDDNDTTRKDLIVAIETFNNAVKEYNDAVEIEKNLKQQQVQAKQDLADGKITQEEFDRIVKAAAEAAKVSVSAGKKMNDAGRDVNEKTDDLKNKTSKLTDLFAKDKIFGRLQGADSVKGVSQEMDAFVGILNTDVIPKMNEGLGKSTAEGLSKALPKISSGINDTMSSVFSSGIGQMIGMYAQIAQLIMSLANAIKEYVTGIINSFSEFLNFSWLNDLVNSILDAISNLIDTIFDLPENLWHVLSSIVVDGVGGLLNTVIGRLGNVFTGGVLSSAGPADWFTNSNAKQVAEKTEKLTKSNENLQKSVDNLKNELSKQSGWKAIDTARMAKEDQQQINEQTMDILRTQMAYHGAHSSNAYYWNLKAKDYDSINETLSRYKTKNPTQDTTLDRVNSLEDIYKLTPEQMDYIRTYNREQWKYITDAGKYDKSEYWENYADLAGQMEEIADSLKEALTGTTFDNMRNNFVSELMDMSKTAQDFSDSFSEMLMQSVLNAKISDIMDDELQDFYKKWAEYAESDNVLDEAEIAELKQEYQGYVRRGMELRDQAAAITGYDGTSAGQKTSSSSSVGTITQDQANELNGRFTALQIAGENINNNVVLVVAYMQNIAELGISTNGAVFEIRNMMIMTNSYLEDMVRYAKLTYNVFGSKMDDIYGKLKSL